MKNRSNNAGLSGKIGGFAVRSMIEDIERKMAQGQQVTAPPPTTQEAQHLQEVQIQNQQSAQNAQI